MRLNLFVAQLRSETDQAERDRLAARIDARRRQHERTVQRAARHLQARRRRAECQPLGFPDRQYPEAHRSHVRRRAREKGLRLRVVPSSAWVRSDAILLERILLNLVSNAVRYTSKGGVVVGCRRVGDRAAHRRLRQRHRHSRGSAAQHLRRVLPDRGDGAGPAATGWGLGLAIVERLGALLEHPIGLDSALGKGSRFSRHGADGRQTPGPRTRGRGALSDGSTRCAAS